MLEGLIKKIKYRFTQGAGDDNFYEYCPRCDANLTLQKGYSNEQPFWTCRGCGMTLTNPNMDAGDDIVWLCDKCGAMLNIQDGFTEEYGAWKCTECGTVSKIDDSELYESEDEYEASLKDPYKGLPDEAVLELSEYDVVRPIQNREDILLVQSQKDGKYYVMKLLKDYNLSVYRYLQAHPVANMPRLIQVYEGRNNLVILEEYIEGKTLSEVLEEGCLNEKQAIDTAVGICRILAKLHGMEQPLIHRDIKPSNVILNEDGEVYLLDINVAKWYQPEETEDTKLYGTLYYAAPEQFGYGFAGSSAKTDIYAVGILLNVMLTGKLPKEKKADGVIWKVIERCISLEPEKRCTAAELMEVLEALRG